MVDKSPKTERADAIQDGYILNVTTDILMEVRCSGEVLRGESMHNPNEDKRKSGRRKGARRVYDLLEDTLLENEKLLLDRLLYGKSMPVDRRVHKRRSGVDRREEGVGVEK